MERRKNKKQTSHEEERYQFIREQVRPQKKKQVREKLCKAGMIVAAACLFGVVAGGIMLYMQEHFGKDEEAIEVASYSQAPKATKKPSQDTKTENRSQRTGLSLEEQNRITERLAGIGDQANYSIVGVKSKGNAKNWYADDKNNSRLIAYGLVVQESARKYYIVTTCEILEDQSKVEVQLLDGNYVEGTVLGKDEQMDVAVISINKSDIRTSIQREMIVAQLSNGTGLVDGTNVIAVGCPDGVLNSVVLGKITNSQITASITDGEVELFCTDMSYSDMSNGVVLDTDGQVVGIITTEFADITGDTGLAFVDISSISQLLERLQNKQTVPYMGLEGKTLQASVAKEHSLPQGAYITAVYSDAPAFKGGLRVADVITRVNGEEIASMQELYQMLFTHKPKDVVTLTIYRKTGKNKVIKNIKVKLE